MIDLIATLLSFVVAVTFIVVVHELGHYLAARYFGVRVLKFSVGFGHNLWSIKAGKQGTEWSLAAIPLGGFVRMLQKDDAEKLGDTFVDTQSFESKPLFARALIALAGPVANFILAIALFTVLYLIGVNVTKSVIGAPPAHTPAAYAQIPAGAEVVAIDGSAVHSWQEARWRTMIAGGESGLSMQLRYPDGTVRQFDWFGQNDGRALSDYGLHVFRPPLAAIIGTLLADSAAERAGLQRLDRVLSINGQAIDDWQQLVTIVQKNPEKALITEIERNGAPLQRVLTPARKRVNQQSIGVIGVLPEVPDNYGQALRQTVRLPLFAAIGQAVRSTWQFSQLSLVALGQMITGNMSLTNLGGPIAIADAAGKSMAHGLTTYLNFLAIISISIGILNLLPIPIFDGGHLLYYAIEAVTQRPLSERFREWGLKFGFVFIAFMFMLVMVNDVNRLFFAS